jgi:hypothetical protein
VASTGIIGGRREWTGVDDHDQPDAVASHLDGVGMAKSVWREPPPHAGPRGGVA